MKRLLALAAFIVAVGCSQDGPSTLIQPNSHVARRMADVIANRPPAYTIDDGFAHDSSKSGSRRRCSFSSTEPRRITFLMTARNSRETAVKNWATAPTASRGLAGQDFRLIIARSSVDSNSITRRSQEANATV